MTPMHIWDDILTPTDREVIRGGAYGKPRGLGDHPALVIIDPQYNYAGADKPILEQIAEWPSGVGESAWRAIERLKLLINAFREKNRPIIYTRQVHVSSSLSHAESLTKNLPVFVRMHGDVLEGNRDLIRKGALPFPNQPWGRPLPELLGEAARGIFVGLTGGERDLVTGVKQGILPVACEPMNLIKEPVATYSSRSLPKTPVRTVFEAVLPILIDSLGQPRTAADLSAYLDVQKTQLDRWIKEATKRGLIKRLTKPPRFVAASIGQQNSLFKKEDVEHE